MERFRGQALAAGCKIAVIANDALGNYVVVTPLLQMLRQRHQPERLDFYSGARTQELWQADENIDSGSAIIGLDPTRFEEAAKPGSYDLVVNVESDLWARRFAAYLCGWHTLVSGPCLGPDGETAFPFSDDLVGKLAADPDWTALDLVNRYPILETGFISEIFCRLSYLQGRIPGYRVPRVPARMPIPEVLIGIGASLADKLWPLERWESAVRGIRREGLQVGLLGAKPSPTRRVWLGCETEERLVEEGLVTDLRGELSLPEVVGALSSARKILTLDNGILHLAASTSTPTVGLFREGIHRLWAPPAPHLTVLIPSSGGMVSEIHEDVVLEALRLAQ